jgi:hypothetical protein
MVELMRRSTMCRIVGQAISKSRQCRDVGGNSVAEVLLVRIT